MTDHRKGQCCHEYQVGTTTYYCVEPFGHQCAHSYKPSMHEVERLQGEIDALRAKLATAERERDDAKAESTRLRALIDQFTEDDRTRLNLLADCASLRQQLDDRMRDVVNAVERRDAAERERGAAMKDAERLREELQQCQQSQ